jgi:hypothetical protein
MACVVYVNDAITPLTAYWLSAASWDEGSSDPKLKKDSEQHPLDALLHSSWIADRGISH